MTRHIKQIDENGNNTFIHRTKEGDEFHYQDGYLIYVRYGATGNQYWYQGKYPNVLHRIDGPAIIFGSNYMGGQLKSAQEWYYEGQHFPNISSQTEWEAILKLKAFW